MKFLSRLVWSEGMYLAPHHFQTQSRYYEDSIAFLANSLWRDPWGLLHLELYQKAIENGIASVLSASGIFSDGLAFDMPTSDSAPPLRNITTLFPTSSTELLLFLAIPARRNDGYDALLTDTSTEARYLSKTHLLRDETNGIDEREVALAHKNISIVTSSEITPQLLVMPLARVLRDTRGVLRYDKDFIPACLRISASDTLMLLLQRLLQTIGDKSETILRGSRRAQRFEPGVSALDVANYWFLHSLHSALPPLRHLIHTRHAHPADCFLELS